ncbi:MAG TPA: hypothetical protein VI864_04860 [Candidatus Bathyarchaeia archaeon]|nr:hypothetical protein [Candidatus Bathyarchaeia archaeon]
MRDIIRTRKIIILAIVIIAVSSTFLFSRLFLQRITDEDIPEIVRLTLERALVDGGIPAYELIKDNESIVLSTENIDLSLIPKLPGVNFTLLSRDEIQEKADREGDFLYLRFNQLKIEDFRVLVSLDNTWAVSKDSKVGYLCGGGFTIEYTKDFFGRLHSRTLCFWTA